MLENADGSVLLSAKKAIYSMPYQNRITAEKKAAYVEGTEIYANSWEYSDVRSFLNGEFYMLAFSEEEKSLVQEQTLDNTNTTAKTESKYATAQTETRDKVFLLSYSDLRNTDYGFTTVVNYDLATSGEKTNDTGDPTVV